MHMGGLEQQGGGGGVLHCNTRVYLQLYFSIREVLSPAGHHGAAAVPRLQLEARTHAVILQGAGGTLGRNNCGQTFLK